MKKLGPVRKQVSMLIPGLSIPTIVASYEWIDRKIKYRMYYPESIRKKKNTCKYNKKKRLFFDVFQDFARCLKEFL